MEHSGWRRLASCAVLMGLLAAWPAAAEVSGREQALSTLRTGNAMQRREAVVELARVGEMADAEALLDALYDDDHQVRRLAETAVWLIWSRSGDAQADTLLRTGIEHMSEGQMDAAVDEFTRVIELHPEFAEGWNKRATAYYLMGDLERSLHDCDEVIRRNPRHFGALSGYGLIYVRRGELEHALRYFERALAVNPNMQGVQDSIDLIRYRLGKEGKRSI